ncbi:hypothetical protein [Trueperella sp. LYQ141]|uniref:hypothetical protein n=1 Tax=Trueperella sp. LYQ141 TaxID=3391058 RepID=UPI0039830EB4
MNNSFVPHQEGQQSAMPTPDGYLSGNSYVSGNTAAQYSAPRSYDPSHYTVPSNAPTLPANSVFGAASGYGWSAGNSLFSPKTPRMPIRVVLGLLVSSVGYLVFAAACALPFFDGHGLFDWTSGKPIEGSIFASPVFEPTSLMRSSFIWSLVLAIAGVIVAVAIIQRNRPAMWLTILGQLIATLSLSGVAVFMVFGSSFTPLYDAGASRGLGQWVLLDAVAMMLFGMVLTILTSGRRSAFSAMTGVSNR